MVLFKKLKDGGPKSNVDGYFILEIKWLFTLVLLKFNKGSREAYHTHAFNALTWFICGDLYEYDADETVETYKYKRSLLPKITKRSKNHKVFAKKNSWCISIRGPWKNTWTEFNKNLNETTTLTKGRKVIGVTNGRL